MRPMAMTLPNDEAINNIAAYFDFMGVSGGYVGMFYEKLIVEGLGAAVYCGGMLLFPMYLNKNFFKNGKPLPKINKRTWRRFVEWNYLFYYYFRSGI